MFAAYLLLQAFLPVCIGIGFLSDRNFMLTCAPVFVLTLTVFSICLTLALRRQEELRKNLAALPASIINALAIFWKLQWWPAGFCALIVVLCGWFLAETAPKGWLKSTIHFLHVLPSLALLGIFPFWLFAVSMGYRETVLELDSPGGHYTATVTSVDQGALGGDTLVEVVDRERSFHILVGSFVKSERLLVGEWWLYETIEVAWQDETTLLLDGKPYSVGQENRSYLAQIEKDLGITLSSGYLQTYEDTHGGFHGDGHTYAVVQGSVAIQASAFWSPLPASGNSSLLLQELSACFPEVVKGQLFFCDRHPESTDPADDTDLYRRSSRNFTLAVWDSDRDILYYYVLDT